MKTKKSGIIAALTAAVLILIAILVTTCLVPINPDSFENEYADYKPVPGKGYVQFKIAGNYGRYVRPDVLDEDGFASYDLYIYYDKDDLSSPGGANGTSGVYDPGIDIQVDDQGFTFPISITNLNHPIDLNEGDYFFKLDAYQYNTTVAATGMSGVITIHENQGNPVTITLEAIGATGSGNGRFDFTFVFASHGYSTPPQMTITRLSPGGAGAGPITIQNAPGAPQTQQLQAGYYQISIPMMQTNYQTAYYIETLWIYAGMTSTLASTTLPALRSTQHTVTFTFGDGRNEATLASETVAHGTLFSDFLTANSDYQAASITHHDDPTEVFFVGWYVNSTDAGLGAAPADAIDPATYRILKNNLALYAGWVEGTTLIFTTSYTPDAIGTEPNVNASVSSFNYDTGDISITFTVTNGSAFIGNYSWSTTVEGPLAETSNVLTLTIDDAAYNYKLYDFDVIVQAFNATEGQLVTTITTVTVTLN